MASLGSEAFDPRARRDGRQTGNGWCGLRDGLDDFWPSRAGGHRRGLGVRYLAAVGTIREISNLFSFTRVQEPRLADPPPVGPPVGSSDTSGLSAVRAGAVSFSRCLRPAKLRPPETKRPPTEAALLLQVFVENRC
jgi:hypothetical protein